jgi:hypothetical protein
MRRRPGHVTIERGVREVGRDGSRAGQVTGRGQLAGVLQLPLLDRPARGRGARIDVKLVKAKKTANSAAKW